VLHRFYPDISSNAPFLEIGHSDEGKGKITLTSDVDEAEIMVDGEFVGNVPSTLTLKAGSRTIEVKDSTGKTWQRDIHVLPDSEVSLKASMKQQ
jgi:hypothetical protein